MPLTGRDLLSLKDYNTEEILLILELAAVLKEKQKKGEPHALLAGKTLAMIFEKASTRTRVSFEVGMWQLGGTALFLAAQDLQLGRGEPLKDTARTLSRYVDGIMVRTYAQEDLEELAFFASVPVINALTDRFHPCQALADLLTIKEHFGKFTDQKLAYIGDGNNVAHSLLLACSAVGLDIVVASPCGYEPEEEIVALARSRAHPGKKVEICNDPHAAAEGATILYTDVWTSMGQEQEAEQRRSEFLPFQLNTALLEKADERAIVLHCLPAHRGEEITDTVIEGEKSYVFDQAENRLHVQKALMAMLMGDKKGGVYNWLK
ncbi:MAG: ornithine carbamoyltransferase [Dethiobacteria bacterium]|jgi:ornithine carbamoyltransferase|nr:ornithine carbamoyltransferase [Bacillota bacterium]